MLFRVVFSHDAKNSSPNVHSSARIRTTYTPVPVDLYVLWERYRTLKRSVNKIRTHLSFTSVSRRIPPARLFLNATLIRIYISRVACMCLCSHVKPLKSNSKGVIVSFPRRAEVQENCTVLESAAIRSPPCDVCYVNSCNYVMWNTQTVISPWMDRKVRGARIPLFGFRA